MVADDQAGPPRLAGEPARIRWGDEGPGRMVQPPGPPAHLLQRGPRVHPGGPGEVFARGLAVEMGQDLTPLAVHSQDPGRALQPDRLQMAQQRVHRGCPRLDGPMDRATAPHRSHCPAARQALLVVHESVLPRPARSCSRIFRWPRCLRRRRRCGFRGQPAGFAAMTAQMVRSRWARPTWSGVASTAWWPWTMSRAVRGLRGCSRSGGSVRARCGRVRGARSAGRRCGRRLCSSPRAGRTSSSDPSPPRRRRCPRWPAGWSRRSSRS